MTDAALIVGTLIVGVVIGVLVMWLVQPVSTIQFSSGWSASLLPLVVTAMKPTLLDGPRLSSSLLL